MRRAASYNYTTGNTTLLVVRAYHGAATDLTPAKANISAVLSITESNTSRRQRDTPHARTLVTMLVTAPLRAVTCHCQTCESETNGLGAHVETTFNLNFNLATVNTCLPLYTTAQDKIARRLARG